ncbi:kremen protein 1 [Electrophorus electricus]|uniref:kremen protein 1 n=1 Tax=Electrophorus electricus TaxID=8005 RepID=UPI0015CF8C97|nr:kremen protein 1 [Electrophorus electricus]
MDSVTVAALLLAACVTASSWSQSDTECYTVNGEDYRGHQKETSLQDGKPCLFWNETFQHPYNTQKYPNGEGGLGSHNYCRNPDGDVRPWCYIADQEDGIYWKFCEIPTCQMPGILGCFKDSGDPPPLANSYHTSQKLTVQNCISFCRNQRYKLAGMEAGYACFCGNDLDYHLHGDAPGLECSHGCFGDQQQPCGGDGHVIVFDTKVGSCGGNYTSPSGVIYSPDFPDKYSPGRVCYWTIQVPGASVLLFTFTFFNIMDQADMVELLDGYTNQVVARFDGRNPPQEAVNITVDFVILYFYSDRTNQAQGFSMIYHAFRDPSSRAIEEEEEIDEENASTVVPRSGSTTEKSHGGPNEKTSEILYVITSSPGKPEHDMPVWTIYVLAALLSLTVIAMVAKLLLHVTVKSPTMSSISGTEACSQSAVSEPWIILYRPSTISLFKKKLKNHHGDLSPLVGK